MNGTSRELKKECATCWFAHRPADGKTASGNKMPSDAILCRRHPPVLAKTQSKVACLIECPMMQLDWTCEEYEPTTAGSPEL